MADVKPRIKTPKSAKAGEAFTIKTLISHNMESGLRKDDDGNLIPRKIINRFTCEIGGEVALDVEMHPGISANPFFEFDAVIEEAGDLKFTWVDDDGTIYEETKAIELA